MSSEISKKCIECQGPMAPIVVMDKDHYGVVGAPQELEYRQPDDKRGFWTGKYSTAGLVRAFMCESCGRIALYGAMPNS
jgi:hypothetical protein